MHMFHFIGRCGTLIIPRKPKGYTTPISISFADLRFHESPTQVLGLSLL